LFRRLFACLRPSRRTSAAEPQVVAAPLILPHVAPSAQPDGGFAVIDVETTGFSPSRDRVVEIAVVRTDQSGGPSASR
jgi:hypothetical protein